MGRTLAVCAVLLGGGLMGALLLTTPPPPRRVLARDDQLRAEPLPAELAATRRR